MQLRVLLPLGVLALGLGAPACSDSRATLAAQEAATALAEAQAVQAAASASADHSVVIASHLYSLYDPGRTLSREPKLVWPGALEAFGKELERIDPRQVFLLGDNTRNARAEEWELLERVLAPLKGRVQFGAGNHDAYHLETFLAHGGVRYGSKVVEGNKYIQLDCVKVLDAEALAFLKRELADAESYGHVFLLMHYFLAGWEELTAENAAAEQPSAGQDPNASGRLTNWHSDVVPLIAGKVDAVFVGDYRHDHVRSTLQYHEGKPIQYVLNSFGYGYDEGVGSGSDGPMMFLELCFEGESFSILPRAVPLDLRHGYFGFAPRMEMRPLLLDWTQVDYADEAAGVAFQLAYPWRVTRGEGIELEARVADPISDGELSFSVHSMPLEGEGEAALRAASAAWLAGLSAEGLSVTQRASLPAGGRLGLWAKVEGQLEGQPVVRWSQVVVQRERAWVFTLGVPGALREDYLHLWNHLMSRVRWTP